MMCLSAAFVSAEIVLKFVPEYDGILATLNYSQDKSYEQLPDYTYLGKDDDGGYYYLTFPTDVQGFVEDDKVMSEWKELESDMQELVKHE